MKLGITAPGQETAVRHWQASMVTFIPPKPPRSLAYLQIECVACRELFTLAEGEQNAPRGESNWRHARTTQPFVWLRFLPPRYLKPSRPQHRPHTHTPELHPAPSDNDAPIPINCPRCGTDNRNWVQILHAPHPLKVLSFWPVALGLLGTLAVFVATLTVYHDQFSGEKRAALFTVLLLAGLAPSLLLPAAWRKEREHTNARGLLPATSWPSPALQISVTLLLVFVFVLPAVLYVAIPLGFDFVADLLALPAPTNLPEHVQKVRDDFKRMAGNIPSENIGMVERSFNGLEKTLGIAPQANDLNGRALGALAVAENLAKEKPDNQQSENVRRELSRIETAIVAAQPPRFDINFFKVWFKHVLAVAVFASLCANWAVAQYVSATGKHLPRPLYYSLADMTRVVAWEMKRTLELPGDLSQIEWIKAERNGLGGLDLTGLLRLAPAQEQTSQFDLVRRYELVSDPWGRIVHTVAKDVQIPAVARATPAEGAVNSEADDIHDTLARLFQPSSRYISL